jgi:hypothetical protein
MYKPSLRQSLQVIKLNVGVQKVVILHMVVQEFLEEEDIAMD